MRFAVKSDRGMVREINEDSYNIIAGYSGIPVTFIIADGMGGHNSGEIASKMAVDFISNYILQFPEILSNEDNIPSAINEIMKKANREVYEHSKQQESYYGMGTTLIAAVVFNKKLFIGHIGDSRVYLIREGTIKRMTIDHSLIEELMQNGTLTKEEAENHPKKNIITRALGCSEEIQVDTYSCRMNDNDIYMLCTDGLTNMLNEDEIKEIIESAETPELACEELINQANERGGNDNTTVMIFRDD